MAVKVAQENFEKNHCLDTIQTGTGNLLVNETEQYDVIIANILAHIIEKMITDAYARLNPNGYFIASGIIEEKRDEIQAQMKAAGFTIINTELQEGWVCIIARKEI